MKPIEGEEKLIRVFGRWPSFHDAEVWSLVLERTERGTSVSATIHTFEMTSEVDSRGYFRLKNHTRVQLRFDECQAIDFSGFNHQNALFGLVISEEDAGATFSVAFEPSHGLSGRLKCRSISVVEAEPWSPPQGVYAENKESNQPVETTAAAARPPRLT